jgi:hypothetical protein
MDKRVFFQSKGRIMSNPIIHNNKDNNISTHTQERFTIKCYIKYNQWSV